MKTLPTLAAELFDTIESAWEGVRARRTVGLVLVLAFLFGLAGVELNRFDLLPETIARITPRSHFYAINLAFTLLLVTEVMSLVFSLAKSISISVGKQFEILSLILIRASFEELVHFNEPIDPQMHMTAVLTIVTNGAAALFIFVVLGFYYRLQPRGPISMTATERKNFISLKKLVALLLLALFILIGGYSLREFILQESTFDFFELFYTLLIFSDILIILVSQRFLPTYHAIFRNSGFALSTLLIRLALTAPPFYNAAIGVAAVLFALGLSLAHRAYYPPGYDSKIFTSSAPNAAPGPAPASQEGLAGPAAALPPDP
jgi:hypothetical protein